MHKSYLVELARQGVAVIPSRILPRGKIIDLSELFSDHNEIVIKPAISATAWHTVRIHREYNQRDQAWLNEQLAERDMLVQPFVPDISNHGELSFMFFDGRYSHAVLKQARDGEFRVQSDFGGTETFYQPGSQEIDEAAAMLRTLENPPLYARVDAARLDGKLVLMELEMIEPQLFLRLHEPAVNQFISAILEKCIDKKTGR